MTGAEGLCARLRATLVSEPSTPNSHGGLPAASGGGGVYSGRPVDVDGGAGATVVDSAVIGVVVVGVDVAVFDDEAAEVTEVGVVLGVPLDEQLDIAMANAVDDIAVTHRRMVRRLTGIATVSRTLHLDSQLIQGLPAGFRL